MSEMHPTHDPEEFAYSTSYSAGYFCRACEVCTCHSPEKSGQPCEFAEPERESSANE